MEKIVNGKKCISIVIPTKGRVRLIEELVRSIHMARMNYEGKTEVLIIDDSDKKEVIKIEQICKVYDAKRIEFGPSVAGKRNKGAELAKYEIILFLDSDCIVTPNLLNEHEKLYVNNKIGGVAGLLKFTGKDSWFWRVVEKSPFVVAFGLPGYLDTVPWTPTANFSVRKDIFEKVGGFDGGFPDKPGGEDVDFGLRITKMGYILKCSKEGLVYHSKETWIPVQDMIRRLWHYGSAEYYLMEKHSDYSMEVLPRKTLLYICTSILLILLSILESPVFLLLIPSWIILDLCIHTIFLNMFAKYPKASLLQQFVLQLLILDNEMGYVFRCLKNRKIFYCFKQTVYFEGQMDASILQGILNTWSNFISLIVLSVIVLFI